jgi:DNA-binding NarL/FixJ family response regulator
MMAEPAEPTWTLKLGSNPRQAMRIIGMVRAGHPLGHILEVGRYHGAWTAADVNRVLADNRLALVPPQLVRGAPRTIQVTPKQAQVIHGVCQGMTNAEIGAATDMPLDTVKSTVSAVLTKTGCRDRIALVIAVLTKRLDYAIEGT